MSYLRFSLILFVILCTACIASKSNEIKEENSETTMEETNKMEEAGYKKEPLYIQTKKMIVNTPLK